MKKFTNATQYKKGSEHPMWKGGVSATKDYWKSDKVVQYRQNYLKRIRQEVIDELGGECVDCGFSDIRALQIDHIDGGGSKERKERTYSGHFHKHVLESVINGENKYQLLCANCNWIKRVVKNEMYKNRNLQ